MLGDSLMELGIAIAIGDQLPSWIPGAEDSATISKA